MLTINVYDVKRHSPEQDKASEPRKQSTEENARYRLQIDFGMWASTDHNRCWNKERNYEEASKPCETRISSNTSCAACYNRKKSSAAYGSPIRTSTCEQIKNNLVVPIIDGPAVVLQLICGKNIYRRVFWRWIVLLISCLPWPYRNDGPSWHEDVYNKSCWAGTLFKFKKCWVEEFRLSNKQTRPANVLPRSNLRSFLTRKSLRFSSYPFNYFR